MKSTGFCRCRTHVLDAAASLIKAMGVLSCLLIGVASAQAQSDELAAIEVSRATIEQAISELGNLAEQRHDGLLFRVDERVRELGSKMLAHQGSASLSDANDPGQRERFLDHLEWLQEFLIDRYQSLQSRILQEQKRFGEFDESSEAVISRAFQQDLRGVAAGHIGLLANLLGLGETLGRIDTDLREHITRTTLIAAEGLSGQILLDAKTLENVRNLIRADPTNAALSKAESAIDRKQVRNIEMLEQLTRLMETVGLNAGSYRTLLLMQRGSIGVDILNKDVFIGLLKSRIEKARDVLITQGPNVVFKTLVFLLVALAVYMLARLTRRIVTALLHRESVQVHGLMEAMLVSLSFGVVFTIGVLLALSTIGISLMPMLAGLGVAGIVIGFALQDTLSNFAAGWMILIYRPYDVDDHVIVGGVEGTVKRMNLVSTTIATFDNQRLVIPNSKIWGDVITNLTANRIRRLTIPVSIAYGEDLDRAENVLRDEAIKHPGVLRKPEPNVFVDAMEQSDVLMVTHAWVRTVDYWPRLRSLTKRLKQRLDEEGIEIPFPQQDIYVRALPQSVAEKPTVNTPESEAEPGNN